MYKNSILIFSIEPKCYSAISVATEIDKSFPEEMRIAFTLDELKCLLNNMKSNQAVIYDEGYGLNKKTREVVKDIIQNEKDKYIILYRMPYKLFEDMIPISSVIIENEDIITLDGSPINLKEVDESVKEKYKLMLKIFFDYMVKPTII